MDALDDQILGILRDDGRATFSAIGREVGLSTNAVAARVRRLEQSGVILGYRAVLASDLPEARAGIEAFIDVQLQVDRDSAAFLDWVEGMREIVDAVHVTGPADYLLHVRTRDTTTLNALLHTLKRDGGAARTDTRLALRDR